MRLRNAKSQIVVWLALAGLTTFSFAFAAVPESDSAKAKRLNLSLKAAFVGGEKKPNRIEGSLTITGWHASKNGLCIYLPYNDPNYGDDRGTRRRLDMLTGKTNHVPFEGGRTEVTHQNQSVKIIPSAANFVLQLVPPPEWASGDELVINFVSQVPKLPLDNQGDWFYDGFYPVPLADCKEAGLDSAYYRDVIATDLSVSLSIPEKWSYAGPGTIKPESKTVSAQMIARNFSFALSPEYKHQNFVVAGIPVNIYYHSEDFIQIRSTIEQVLPAQIRLFGNYPFQSLTVIETDELQRTGLSGIIALNRPRQPLFSVLQKNWLNWQHWTLTNMLASQWYGTAIVPNNPDDEWLLSGIVEFATLETLKQLPEMYNLFNLTNSGYRLLSFDYLQISEVLAATLERSAPFSTLTNKDLYSYDPRRLQHPLLYIKQALAMRQLKANVGEQPFYGILRNLTASHLHQKLGPREFHDFLGQLPSPLPPTRRKQVQTWLSQWWTEKGWPDFQLEEFSTELVGDNQWVARVRAGQKGEIDFPPLIGVRDQAGRTYYVRAEQQTIEGENSWFAEILTQHEPEAANVDPLHESFDANRFNNTSETPSINFFPGNADTLKDDAYTLVWTPYAFKRPGEPFSIGLQGAAFRYIQGGLSFAFETAPSERLNAFRVRQRYQVSDLALDTDFNVEQTFDGDRSMGASLTRSPLFKAETSVDLTLRALHKLRLGQPKTAHQTFAVGLGTRPINTESSCLYATYGEFEHAPKALGRDFTYNRKYAWATISCNMFGSIDFGLRLFSGSLNKTGDIPESTYFKPNDLKEAHLRIDVRNLPKTKNIATTNTEITFPLLLPLPGHTLVLTRQIRGKVYFDYGRALDEKIDYRAAGFGFTLPFGGDLMGAGSLSITRLSLLAVLYTNIDGEVSRKPSLIFSWAGDL